VLSHDIREQAVSSGSQSASCFQECVSTGKQAFDVFSGMWISGTDYCASFPVAAGLAAIGCAKAFPIYPRTCW
jgi:hypothetical protein